ncbi:cupin domain-containing protein [Tepidicella baoligensis]|uniref:cupin domain-containing protein n=1 Tax=Tepidicella baoligensis TaxID=2707016 RepID=UPI0015DAFCB9|nr:cupin domain-containing protein [Tepidicella baoligensis]
MSAHDLLSFGHPVDGVPDISHPHPDRRIAGNPLRETWNLVDAPLGRAETFSTGIWRCEPGHWAIAFGPTEREVFTVLEGRCRVRRFDGSHEEAGPGQSIHIPPGFTGSFEVLETVVKVYVIVE